RQLGADEVLACEETDLRHHQGQYDLVVDAYGNLRYKDFKRIGKRGVAIGFTNMKTLLSLALKKKSGKFPFTLFTVKLNRENLESLRILFEQNKSNHTFIKPIHPIKYLKPSGILK